MHELMLVDVCVCTNCIHADMFVCGVHVFDLKKKKKKKSLLKSAVLEG